MCVLMLWGSCGVVFFGLRFGFVEVRRVVWMVLRDEGFFFWSFFFDFRGKR